MGNEASTPTPREKEFVEDQEEELNSDAYDSQLMDAKGGTTGNASSSSPVSTDASSGVVSEAEIKSFFGDKLEVVISRQVFELANEISQIRRYFHIHPELSFKEEHTSQNIIGYLKELGIEVESRIGGTTGVVGTLHGRHSGPCILLRADMDGLPISEEKTEYNKKYISENEGISHACGHDAHMAILLGTASVLCKLQEYLHGTVKFCFQCAEEQGAGANRMIREGILEQKESNSDASNKNDMNKNASNIRVDQVYGLHVWSYIPFGKCIVQRGAIMAGCVMFKIDLIGKGGHGAIPKGTNDAVLAVAHLTQQLQSIVSRNILPVERGVVTVGKIEAGTRSNVIAESARIEGTIRWFDSEIYKLILSRVDSICRGVETSFDVKCNFTIDADSVNPVMNSDEQCVLNVKNAVSQVLPDEDTIIKNAKPTMAAEDFSVFLEQRPGCFFLLGCGIEGKEIAHHTPRFEIDERCLTVGTQIMCTLVLDLLLPIANVVE